MMSIQKIIGAMSCSFLLCLGLAGCAVSATDEMKAGQSAERIGGQAGLADHLESRMSIADLSAGMRIGGQAGITSGLENQGGAADLSAGMRMGGQAGMAGDLENQESVANN